MKLIFIFPIVLFLVFPSFTWGAGNQNNRTLTVNTGMGVNNNGNKNLSTSDAPGVACSGGNAGSCGNFGGATGPYADTSDPFNPNDDCSPGAFGDFCSSQFDPNLPGGFNVADKPLWEGGPLRPE